LGPPWTTTDVNKFISHKKGPCIVDTVEFPPSKMAMPHTSSKDLARIAALEMSSALQNPASAAPFSNIGTSQLQALRQLSEIFSAAFSSRTAKHAPPVAQTSSQFRSTVPPVYTPEVAPLMREPPVSATSIQSPQLAQHQSHRMSPMIPMDISSSRVTHKLPITSVITLALHPATENAPYMPQGMAGMNLFDTFEEEHMETSALPR
jgi:hypothetical protein